MRDTVTRVSLRLLQSLGCLTACALAFALSAGAPTRSHAAQTTQAESAQAVYFAEGWYVTSRTLRYRPRRMWLSGNGSFLLTRMRWRGWGSAVAIGRGTARVNDCEPDCASGTLHPYRVRVVFTAVRHLCGHRLYTHARHTYLGAKPPGSPSRVSWGGPPVCGN